ncbi:MAG: hypothetical protein WBG50_16995 [Desulfomonilaceae bacterium]
MFSKLVGATEALHLLDLADKAVLEQSVAEGLLKPAKEGPKGRKFLVADIVMFKLAQTISHVGVEPHKAARYSEAILGTRLQAHDKNVVDWIENETQELFCFIADDELTRIFLRNIEDSKEVDVGAVKPMLFPTTKCEINVFRVIRPVVFRTRQLLGPK